MSYPIKWFSNAHEGAPQLSAAAGSLVAVLDACLINGFGVRAAASLTVTSGIATLTFPTAHAYPLHGVIEIGGATPAGLNGEQRVTQVTATALQFAAPGIPDGAATGTLTCKIPPVGSWQALFTATNKRMYRSIAPGATGICLRVDDSNAASGWNTNGCNSRIAQVINPTDLDTWTEGWSPTDACVRKSDQTTGTLARDWLLIADGYYFHLLTRPSPTGSRSLYGHGDIHTWRPGDQYHCLTIAGATAYGYTTSNGGDLAATNYRMMAREYTQAPGAVATRCYGHQVSNYLGWGGFAYPAPVDNALLVHSPIHIGSAAAGIRGVWPGVLQILQTVTGFSAPQILTELDGLSGLWLAYPCGASASATSADGTALFDLIGPWR